MSLLNDYMTREDLMNFWEWCKSDPLFAIILSVLFVGLFILFAWLFISATEENERIEESNVNYIRNLDKRIKQLENEKESE